MIVLGVVTPSPTHNTNTEAPSTPVVSQQTITIMEGDSVNISCNSVGNPLPSIRWRLGMNDAPFGQVTESTPLNYTGGTITEAFSFTAGDTTSTLLIVNAVYPDHSGVYECVGVNSHDGVESVSIGATITVDVQRQWLKHAYIQAWYYTSTFCIIHNNNTCRLMRIIFSHSTNGGQSQWQPF